VQQIYFVFDLAKISSKHQFVNQLDEENLYRGEGDGVNSYLSSKVPVFTTTAFINAQKKEAIH
jgi:hypothetical protein